MSTFGRKSELFIGVFKDESNLGNGYLVDGLNYEFNIDRSTEFYKDSATFSIYNPNQQTINEITNDGKSVVFRAGYDKDKFGTIFVGQIAKVYCENDEGDDKLILICNSQRGAQYPLARTFITVVIDKGNSYYDVLKSIADYVGIPISGAEVLKKYKLDEDYIVCGTVREEVKIFVNRMLRKIGGSIIISNNELIYLDKNDNAIFETVYLSFKTGLISAKKNRNETYQSSEDAFEENREYYLGLRTEPNPEVVKRKILEASIKPRNEIQFECYIHPGLQIGAPVQIDAWRNEEDQGALEGLFYVTSLHYQGDNFGNQFICSGIAVEKE